MTILIRRVRDESRWLGNLVPYPVTYDGTSHKTSEALFQSLRSDDGEIIDEIRKRESPMSAKMVAKRYRDRVAVEPMGELDLDNMRLCLQLKLSQHPQLRRKLEVTGSQTIIEDCTRRPHGSGLFWGAALIDEQWIGENWLGRLWMELRSESMLHLIGDDKRGRF